MHGPLPTAANRLLPPVLLFPRPHRKLTDKLKLLMQPDKGFAEEGDVEGALQGFGPQATRPGLDGVTAACARAALAHRLFSRRLLSRLRVSWDV